MIIGGVLYTIILACSLCALVYSARVAINDDLNKKRNIYLDIVSHEKWSIAVIFILIITVGDLGRGEISPIPWEAFYEVQYYSGLAIAILYLILILVTHLWLFWNPSQMIIQSENIQSTGARWSIRLMNIMTGLLLSSENNAVYRSIENIAMR